MCLQVLLPLKNSIGWLYATIEADIKIQEKKSVSANSERLAASFRKRCAGMIGEIESKFATGTRHGEFYAKGLDDSMMTR